MKNQYEIRGDITVIYVNHKGENLECVIDTNDLELVSSIKGTWSFSKGYVIYRIQKKTDSRQINIHRLLTGAEEGKCVDHINHDTLDNRKINLRVVTHAENMQNMSANKGSRSGIRDVHWFRNRWVVRLMVNGTNKHFGTFTNKFEAEKVAKEARAKYMPGSQEALAQ